MKVISPNYSSNSSTFTRNSVGTYFDISGTLRDAAINELRINFNPDGNMFEGALIEPSITNYLLNSETLVTQTRSLPAGVYTFSFYGSGVVNVTGITDSFGLAGVSLVTRVSRTFTVPFGGASVQFQVTSASPVKYAQCENNSYATSWFRTSGSFNVLTHTRAADIVSNPGIFYNNFQSYANWQNYIEYKLSDLVWDGGNVYQSLIADNFGLQPSLSAFAWKNVQSTIEYSALVTYNIGDYCRSNNLLFKSLTASNIGNNPNTSFANWEYVRTDNSIAMFDRNNSNKAVANGNQAIICFKVEQPNVNSCAAIATNADALTVVINKNNGQVISRQVVGVPGSETNIGGSAAVLDLEAGDVVSVFLTRLSKVIQVSEIVTGTSAYVGMTQYGLGVSIRDFSKKGTDDNGNSIFIKKDYSKKLTAKLVIENSIFNGVVEVLTDLRSDPCVWIATEDSRFSQGAIVFGFIKDFNVAVEYPNHSLCSLEIEGLI